MQYQCKSHWQKKKKKKKKKKQEKKKKKKKNNHYFAIGNTFVISFNFPTASSQFVVDLPALLFDIVS